jgi:hypothetical protein
VTAAYIVVVALALLPQILFSVLYWKWIPTWTKNPYGRLAQLGAWCHIIFLSVLEVFLVFGRHMNPNIAKYIFLASFSPLIFYGIFQLSLLKRAVDSVEKDSSQGEEVARDN